MTTSDKSRETYLWAGEIREYGLLPVITGKLRTYKSLLLTSVASYSGLSVSEARQHLDGLVVKELAHKKITHLGWEYTYLD